MSRKLATALSWLPWLSLPPCAAALAAWPASHWRSARAVAWWGGPAGGPPAAIWAAGVTVDTGHASVLAVVEGPSRASRQDAGVEADVGPAGLVFSRRTYGWDSFRWSAVDARPAADVRRYRLVAPLWAWALAYGLPPGWRANRWWRHRRRQRGPAGPVSPAFEVVRRDR